MSFSALLAVAVALAMDAFAVSIAAGVSLKKVSFRQTFRLSWHFGLFQALMPVLGWAGGLTFRSHIESFDHWVAFALLAFVGGKMIKEAFEDEGEETDACDPTRGMTMVMLAIATSIDALAVGLSFSILGVAVWYPAAVIGLVALVFTACGIHLGRLLGHRTALSIYAEFIGGVVLLLIGAKILYEHGALPFLA